MIPKYLGPARSCESARSITDIRDQHRESMKTQRYETRFAHMLKKRGLMCDEDKSDNCLLLNKQPKPPVPYYLDDWDSALDTERDFNEISLGNSLFDNDQDGSATSESCHEVDLSSSDSWDPSSWFSSLQPHPQRPCNAPSPSLSVGSESSFGSLNSSPQPQSRRNRRPRSRHESLVLRKRVTETCKDHESVRRQFDELKSFLVSNSSKPELLITTLTSRWKTISDAILHQDTELMLRALNLTEDLVSSRWIKTEDLLFILQQGFLLTLKESLVRSGNHQAQVIKLILAIIRHGPGATPYIVQVISSCGLLETFSELLLMGSFEDTQMVVQFYSEVFQVLCGLAASDEFAPTVPVTIAASNSTRKLSELYDPIKTLKLIVQPASTATIINSLFKKIGYIECETLRSSVVIVSNFIRYVTFYLQHFSPDTKWARSMAETFEREHIETFITGSIVNGSIDHYPGSVKVELQEFLDFYRCWNDEISHYLHNC